MDIIKIAAMGLSGVLLALFFKESRPIYGILMILVSGICILGMAEGKLIYLFQKMLEIQNYFPVDMTFLSVILKMMGISYLGQFASGICKDAGYSSIGSQIEMFAKLAILVLSMPVLFTLLDTFQGLLE